MQEDYAATGRRVRALGCAHEHRASQRVLARLRVRRLFVRVPGCRREVARVGARLRGRGLVHVHAHRVRAFVAYISTVLVCHFVSRDSRRPHSRVFRLRSLLALGHDRAI